MACPAARALYTIERVEFASHDETVVGRLYRPTTPVSGDRPPVAVVVGPVASVKEQSPKQYATRLASRGVAALVFDPRHFGESGGQPRQFENPTAKAQDVRAAVDYVSDRPDVDTGRLSVLGICQGANWAIDAAVADPRIRRLSLVSGHFLYPTAIDAFFEVLFQGRTTAAERIESGRAARERYEATGEADYIPIVGTAEEPDRLLPAQPTYQFYIRWADRGPAWRFHGLWENRIAKMSEETLWAHRADQAVKQLHTPALVVVGDKSATPPPHVQALLDAMPGPHELRHLGPIDAHIQFYDDPELIDRAAAEIIDWHLMTEA
ncbi:alpha/beta hydrolase [Streptomyces sp. A1136]|uniref:alpha/beta hydrolase n=1 Tax=Streptomyces sp. A1136 TaxID=2563102 RepID=UPI00109EDA62|nr:alpha/beta hydrolase [Streptomyces sp. A1136]THA47089.1 alpha/beta hydrolase [Streptomyces sp. A1136]